MEQPAEVQYYCSIQNINMEVMKVDSSNVSSHRLRIYPWPWAIRSRFGRGFWRSHQMHAFHGEICERRALYSNGTPALVPTVKRSPLETANLSTDWHWYQFARKGKRKSRNSESHTEACPISRGQRTKTVPCWNRELQKFMFAKTIKMKTS